MRRALGFPVQCCSQSEPLPPWGGEKLPGKHCRQHILLAVETEPREVAGLSRGRTAEGGCGVVRALCFPPMQRHAGLELAMPPWAWKLTSPPGPPEWLPSPGWHQARSGHSSSQPP